MTAEGKFFTGLTGMALQGACLPIQGTHEAVRYKGKDFVQPA